MALKAQDPARNASQSAHQLRLKEASLLFADDSSQTRVAVVEHLSEGGAVDEYRVEFPLHQEQSRPIGKWGNVPLPAGIIFNGDLVVPVYEHARLDVYVLDPKACGITYGYSLYISSADRHGLSTGVAEHEGDLLVGVHELSGLVSTHAEQLTRCEAADGNGGRCTFGFGAGALVRLRRAAATGRLQVVARHATATEQPYQFFYAKGGLYLINAGCQRFLAEPAPACFSSIQQVLGSAGLGPPTVLPAGLQAGQAHVVAAASTDDGAYRIVMSELFGAAVATLRPHDGTDDSAGMFAIQDVLRFDGHAWRNHTTEPVRQGWNKPLVIGGITELNSDLESELTGTNSSFHRNRRAGMAGMEPFANFEVSLAVLDPNSFRDKTQTLPPIPLR